MLEKDRLNILSIHEAVGKIFNYSKSYSNADDFYQNQRDFDAEEVWQIIQTHLPQLKKSINKIVNCLLNSKKN